MSAERWHGTAEDWLGFFERQKRVVFLANSDAVTIDEVVDRHGADALFVFFNKVYKVLSEPFTARALLVARSSPVGANIVYRREVDSVLRFFPEERFEGVLNLACDAAETLSAPSAFGGRRAGSLQLAEYFDGFYPSSHKPTSGFALAVWLAERSSVEICLEGFTARRSLRWKLFADHDWIFEQTALRLLARSGRIAMAELDARNPYGELAARFPGIDPSSINATAVEVLSDRAESTGIAIDRLISLTRPQAKLGGILRRLKPKTRKERAAEAKSNSDDSSQ